MERQEYTRKIKDLVSETQLLLPDFQRDFVWKASEQQSKLICSLFLELPVGSILVLDHLEGIGTRHLCYKGNQSTSNMDGNATKLLMDGQQRISTIKSVFSNLYEPKSDWKEINKNLHKELRYRWFLDLSLPDDKMEMERKLKILYNLYWNRRFEDSLDMEDIQKLFVCKKITDKNKTERWHPSPPQSAQAGSEEEVKNYCSEKMLIPLFFVLSEPDIVTSLMRKIAGKYLSYLKDHRDDESVCKHINFINQENGKTIDEDATDSLVDLLTENVKTFFNDTIAYRTISGLEYKEGQLNKAILAFNTMNTAGISLGVFDIVSAKYSSLQIGRLSDCINKMAEDVIGSWGDENNDIKDLIDDRFIKGKDRFDKNFTDMYLNMLSLFKKEKEANNGFNLDCIKQKSLLEIKADEIKEHSNKAVCSLVLAFQFLIERCGVPSIKDIKYKLTVLPVAYSFYKSKDNSNLDRIKKQIEYSYWMSLFSGKYEKGQNAVSIEHLNDLLKYIENPTTNPFEKYATSLCNKEGYSDFKGFESFYREDSPYPYSSNIGEYFLQFVLARSLNKEDLFKKYYNERKIEIKHFHNLHKDHILPKSWFSISSGKKPVNSVLNQFYSPATKNWERLNNSITEEVDNLEVLCIPKGLDLKKEIYKNNEEMMKDFLEKRFKLFEKKIKKYLDDLKNT